MDNTKSFKKAYVSSHTTLLSDVVNKITPTEQKLMQKENFLEALAHDLKSPVFSQIQALNLLIGNKSFTYNPFQKEILDQLLISNIYMRDMLHNVLYNFKTQKSDICLSITKNNIKNTIFEALESISFMLKQSGIAYSVKFKNKYRLAYFDNTEIKRVLVNLISNAAKYGIKNTLLEIFAQITPQGLNISVINYSEPIEKSRLDSIFDLYQTDCKKHKTTGSGLGLYIAKKIIEAHGGKIWAKNLENKKVEFGFFIPQNTF